MSESVPTHRIAHDHRLGELWTENVDFVEIGEVVRRSKWLETGLERSEHDAHAEVGDDAEARPATGLRGELMSVGALRGSL